MGFYFTEVFTCISPVNEIKHLIRLTGPCASSFVKCLSNLSLVFQHLFLIVL